MRGHRVEENGADVLAVVPDLIFASRIESLAKQNDQSVEIVGSLVELERSLARQRPCLVLVDLSARGVDVSAAIRAAKAAGVPTVIAFGPHKDVIARAAALEAGADQWVTNQRLLETLSAMRKT
ncbi:MAG TPA: hypothetical protein VNL16_19125 [Chloroflexota bacterium]|nr:hypothetical protein [Chloroflexota bacterium]